MAAGAVPDDIPAAEVGVPDLGVAGVLADKGLPVVRPDEVGVQGEL